MARKFAAANRGEVAITADEHTIMPVPPRSRWASATLALVSAAAVVTLAAIWWGHGADERTFSHQQRVVQAAVDWTSELINLNLGNAEIAAQTLRDGTAGELRADFDAAVKPYLDAAKARQRGSGKITSVSIESLHPEGGSQPSPVPVAGPAPTGDTVLITATSVGDAAEGQPAPTIQYCLRVGVSEVDGKLLISRLERIR